VETDTDETGRAFNLQVKVSSQGWINGDDLRARIHHKVVRTGMIDNDWNNDLGALDESEA
jgi:hypothetical protein